MFGNNILVADATGEHAKLAHILDGTCVKDVRADGPALENFASMLTGSNLSEVDSLLLAHGPGSILGTRVASMFFSIFRIFSNAKLYSFDILRVSALVHSTKIKKPFTLLTPSRKGYVNILDFDSGRIKCEREIAVSSVPISPDANIFLLSQKDKVDFGDFPRIDPTMFEIWSALRANPDESQFNLLPIEAKSLSERKYAKWKAQAPI